MVACTAGRLQHRSIQGKVSTAEAHARGTLVACSLLQVDILNTEAHNARLAETLKLLDDELREKLAAIEKYELEIKRRNDEIERKTRDIDVLNRR